MARPGGAPTASMRTMVLVDGEEYLAGEEAAGLLGVKRQKALGAISVKSYNQPRREQRQQILEAARQTDMMVVPEGGSLFEANMTMVVDGHTGVEHAIPVANAYDDVKQLWGQTQVGYTPTYNVAYGGLDGEHYFYAIDPETRAFTDSLKYQNGALDASSKQLVIEKLAKEGALDAAREAGITEQAYA